MLDISTMFIVTLFFSFLQRNLNKALRVESIDSSSGVMALYYDYDCNVVYVAGKVREKKRETERKTEREGVFVYLCVSRERTREHLLLQYPN